MTTKIAVAVVHGVGSQKATFAKALSDRLRARFAHEIADESENPEDELQIRGVYWAKELADQEHALETRFHRSHLRWGEARNIMIDIGGDALAYQLNRMSASDDNPGTYERIHMTFAGTLRALTADAGPTAPLCIIAHSLGTVIVSNYLWDLQTGQVPAPVNAMIMGSPLERGKTLTSLYTIGSPIAVWSLRFPDFGVPITFPPADLIENVKKLPAEWCNLFDKDDVIAYPLKCLNDRYDASVTEDLAVNVGNLITMWNPAAHVGYWTDPDVIRRIADGLVLGWRAANPAT